MPALVVVIGALWILSLPSLLSPRRRAIRVTTMALVYVIGETVTIICCFGLWLVRAGPGPHARLLKAFLGALIGLAKPVFGFRLHVGEEDRFGTGPAIVLARHAGPGASFALVHLLMARYDRRPHVVLKEQLRWDPAIDLLLTRIGCTWIARDTEASVVGEAARDLEDREALVLFPEGADWTPLRHIAAVARLRRKGLLKEARAALRMPHVLPPRPAGTVAALQANPSADVLVFTHAGHDELLDAGKAWAALPLSEPLEMAWWRADDVPSRHSSADDIEGWLTDTWERIDSWVSARED